MDFNTLLFPCFFAASVLGYYLLPGLLRPAWLLAASYLFYCWKPANRRLAAVLLGATLFTWICGWLLSAFKNQWARRGVMLAGVLGCLSPLFLFKYYNFFVQSLSALTNGQVPSAPLDLAAPLGLSYFTFQTLGYVIDCYRGKYPPERNPLKYALFVSFFPCVFTGPIERADHLLPQLDGRSRLEYDNIAGGAFRMLWGYFKKMVLADRLAVFVRAYYVGAVAATGPAQAAAAVLFSLQLYFDFSGCCDIAVGGARMFGIRLLENFENPFLSTSFSELWRRWHKSLNGWFRDYLYFSLGGSRCPLWRWVVNLMVVFVLSGLWHGAAAGYLWWGLLCGALVLLERLPQKLRAAFSVPQGGRHTASPKAAAAPHPAVCSASPGVRQNAAEAVCPKPAAPASAWQWEPIEPPAAPAADCGAASAPPQKTAVQKAGAFLCTWARRLLVFCEFSVCFILFAAALYGAGEGLQPYRTLFTGWNGRSIQALGAALAANGLTGPLFWVLTGGSLLVFAVESRGNVAEWIRRRLFVWRWPLYYALAAALLFFGVFGQSAFIYQLY